jgi:hypothetical protein
VGYVKNSTTVALLYVEELVRAQGDISKSITRAVGKARARGATWTQIGDALGVTRQAARQRFGP